MKKIPMMALAALLFLASTYGPRNQTGAQVLKGPYLGQKRPRMKPALFPPAPLRANEAWFWHGSPCFSPGLDEIYFVKYIKGRNIGEMCRMKKTGDIWGSPEKVSFAEARARDNNPFFLDRETLLFYSTRFGGSICRVKKTGDQWSEPVALILAVPAGKRLGSQFSVTKRGVLYAELWNADESDADFYRWQPVDGQYPSAEKLRGSVNSSSYDFMPFVDPEEKYLIFCSQRPGGCGKTDLYVSFRNVDGTWTEAVNMGPLFNTAGEEGFPSISPDGRYVFFCREGESGFNPYWVDARIIEKSKPRKLE
ncbi:MAG: hypothetical protein ABFD80_02720 [Acidobacteriota bacterium]